MSEKLYQDNYRKIYCGDSRQMTEMADECVQCVVTSPPYWGLRKYSGEQDLIWGDNHCEHEWGTNIARAGYRSSDSNPGKLQSVATQNRNIGHSNICVVCGAWKGSFGLEPTPEMYVQHTIEILREIRRVLRKDGVVFWNLGDSYAGSNSGKGDYRAKKGLQRDIYDWQHPQAYAGVQRVGQSGKRGKGLSGLKAGGSSFENPYDECADCQLNSSLGIGGCPVQELGISNELSNHSHKGQQTAHLDNSDLTSPGGHNEGETLGLCSSPELADGVSPAAQESNEIASSGVSHQSQPDPTCSYYQSFQHSASQSNYTTFNLKPKDLCLIPFRVAISAQEDGWWVRSVIIWNKPNPMPESVTDRPTGSHEYILMLTKSKNYYWDAEAVRESFLTPEDDKSNHTFGAPGGKAEAVYGAKHLTSGKKWKPKRGYKTKVNQGSFSTDQHHGQDIFPQSGGRNIRSVWTFPTQPYPEAHFAVFPEKLPELCIKAATPEVGCCSECGAPWARVLKGGFTDHNGQSETEYPVGTTANRLARLRQAAREQGGEYQNAKETVGWRPTCKCNADKVPSVVLDPFMGAGTTLLVAAKLGQRAVGYELSEEYCQLAVDRNKQMAL